MVPTTYFLILSRGLTVESGARGSLCLVSISTIQISCVTISYACSSLASALSNTFPNL